jgi:predicted outer membrane repeat protein
MQPSSQSRFQFQSVILRTFLSLLLLVPGVSAAAAAGHPAPASGSGQRIWLDAPRNLSLRYAGGRGAAALSAGHAEALSLAQGDLDEDGVADLVIGYATGNGGAVAIHRGNPDARAPRSHKGFLAAGRGQFPDPVLPQVEVLDVGVTPDLLAIADLDGDGHKDIIIGSRTSATLYVLFGDGKGKFSRTLQLRLPGVATALAAQRMDRGSACWTLLVGVTGVKGAPPALVVFTARPAGIRPLFSLPLPAPLTSFAFGDLDNDAYPDAALIAGGQVFILHGADVREVTAGTGAAHLEAVSASVNAVAVDVGSFINDRDPRQQLAVLDSDGSVRIVTHQGLDTRPWSAAELTKMHKDSLRGHPRILAADPNEGWMVAESFPGLATGSRHAVMVRTRISGKGLDDIVVADPGSGQLHQLSHASVRHQQQLVNGLPPSSHLVMPLNSNQPPVAMLAMHVNIDARPGLVMVNSGEVSPRVMMPAADPTFYVNTTLDLPLNVNGNTCANISSTDTSSMCSVREAVTQANAVSGSETTIVVVAGTYNLTIPPVTGVYDSSAGALDITEPVIILGDVDGSGNPATIIQAGTTTSNGIDKIFGIDPNLNTAFDTQLTNLVLQNGYNRQPYTDGTVFPGFGGAIQWEAYGTGTLEITNCTIQNNTTTDGDGGGISADNALGGAGAITITGSTIQSNAANEASTGGSGIGGGIFLGASTPMTMTNTQILNNQAMQGNSPAGQGGGIFTFDPAAADVEIQGSISGNQAAGDGGGIYAGGGININALTVISNNTAGADGGGLWYNGYDETTTITKCTFTGNTATGNGGAIEVDTSNTGNDLTLGFSRLAGNGASSGSNLYNAAGTVTATNNWWGTNLPAGTISGTVTFDPYIVLTLTPSPNQILIDQDSTLTADMSKDDYGNGTALAGNLDVLNAVPITFDDAILGTILEPQPEALTAAATATATFSAGSAPGAGQADAVVDQATVTAGIAVVAQQTITFPAIPDQSYPTVTVSLTATASSGLPVSYVSMTPAVCTATGSSVALLTPGNICTIQASQTGDSSYLPAAAVSQSFVYHHQSQTISFAVIPSQVIGATITLTATASSGLAVTFAATTPSVCSVSGNTATMNATGYCGITASQPGNNDIWEVIAGHTFYVALAPQTITFANPGTQTYGEAPFTVSATASSGLTVSFGSTTPLVCTVSGTTVTLVSPGYCGIVATQPGNGYYGAAPAVGHTFYVAAEAQTITFANPGTQTYGEVPFTVSATASSGLTVSFGSTTPLVCTVSGTTVTLVSPGYCGIVATQVGNGYYGAAPAVGHTFYVAAEAQTITFANPGTQTYGEVPFTVSATASSGLTVSFASTTPLVCTVSGATVTLVSPGYCGIVATQPGNGYYGAAPAVGHTFLVVN